MRILIAALTAFVSAVLFFIVGVALLLIYAQLQYKHLASTAGMWAFYKAWPAFLAGAAFGFWFGYKSDPLRNANR
jgi:hypothetical protein